MMMMMNQLTLHVIVSIACVEELEYAIESRRKMLVNRRQWCWKVNHLENIIWTSLDEA
jgi:hypothetical protein